MLEYHLSEIDNSRLLFLPVSVHEYLQPESRWLGSASKRVIGISGELLHKIHLKEGLSLQKGVVLHSDNGSPMKGATMLATMLKRGVIPSFRRPSVSNNNAYSESLFKTMKYTPAFPDQPFSFLPETRNWVANFVQWYNEEHRHCEIQYVTPGQRHRAEDIGILEERSRVYEAAKKRNPER